MQGMLRSCYCLLLVACALAAAADKGEILAVPAEELNVVLRQTPMPEMGDSRIAKILQRYYQAGLGGAENWDRIESLNVAGTLSLDDVDCEFVAYQKKPNLLKMSFRKPPNPNSVVLAYDGELAWQHRPADSAPGPMPASEARRFIHSSQFGNYLLYPFAEGKTIRYMDTVPAEGSICHQIRVVLDTGYQVDYFIDIRSYLETKVENTDLRSGVRNSVVYKDYTVEYGVPIATQVESYEDGEWVSSLSLTEVKVNSGVMPWMFQMPESE